KGNDIGHDAAAKRVQMRQNIGSHAPVTPTLLPRPELTLGCHCGNFGQELSRELPCIMVNGDRVLDGLRLRHRTLSLRGFERRLDERWTPGNARPPVDKLTTRDFVCGI